MVDPTLLVSVVAVGVSAGVALFAVYLGYRYQLRTQRAERLIKAFSDVMTDVEDAYGVATAVGGLCEAAAAVASVEENQRDRREGGADAADARTAVSRILDDARMIDLASHLGWSALYVMRPYSLGDRSAPESAELIKGMRDRARALFFVKAEKIIGSAETAYMNGAKKESRESILTFQAALVRTVNTCESAGDVARLKGDKDALASQLRQAAEV